MPMMILMFFFLMIFWWPTRSNKGQKYASLGGWLWQLFGIKASKKLQQICIWLTSHLFEILKAACYVSAIYYCFVYVNIIQYTNKGKKCLSFKFGSGNLLKQFQNKMGNSWLSLYGHLS